MDIPETFDFVQHIDKPTHNSGHLLDYIITMKDSSGVSNLHVSDFIRDHRALHVSLTCSRAHPERKQMEVRSLKCTQCEVLEADLIGVNIDRECTDVNQVVRQYDASLPSLMWNALDLDFRLLPFDAFKKSQDRSVSEVLCKLILIVFILFV